MSMTQTLTLSILRAVSRAVFLLHGFANDLSTQLGSRVDADCETLGDFVSVSSAESKVV